MMKLLKQVQIQRKRKKLDIQRKSNSQKSQVTAKVEKKEEKGLRGGTDVTLFLLDWKCRLPVS